MCHSPVLIKSKLAPTSTKLSKKVFGFQLEFWKMWWDTDRVDYYSHNSQDWCKMLAYNHPIGWLTVADLTVPKVILSTGCSKSWLSKETGRNVHIYLRNFYTFFCWIWLSIPSLYHLDLSHFVHESPLSTSLAVFFSLLLCLCPSLYPRPPSLPTYTLCLTHLLSARQVHVAKRQAMSDGPLFRERPLSIMISHLHACINWISLMGVVVLIVY